MKIEPQIALIAVDFFDSFSGVISVFKGELLSVFSQFSLISSLNPCVIEFRTQRIHKELKIVFQKFSIQCLIKS